MNAVSCISAEKYSLQPKSLSIKQKNLKYKPKSLCQSYEFYRILWTFKGMNGRMLQSTVLYTYICALLLTLCGAQFGSTHPCHPGRNVEKLGADCEFIRFPPEMCSKCSLRGYSPLDGAFNDCSSIYKIEQPGCKAEIGKYVDLNKCDAVRRKQFQDFFNPENFMALDYFVYAICEECCDCIPRKSTEDEYEHRLSEGSLINLRRGNCPAHAFYDICRVWPEVRFISSTQGEKMKNWPKMCPMVQSWYNSEESRGWLTNEETKMDGRLRRFLEQFNREARCRNDYTWKMCVGLEKAQNRVWYPPYIDLIVCTIQIPKETRWNRSSH